MFLYRKGSLTWDGIDLLDAAKEWGTPAYLYNRKALENDFTRLQQAFEPYTHSINFALKANSNPELVKLISKLGCGADIVSMGELFIALKAGISHEKMVFAGVGKTDEEINIAIKSRLLAISAESEEEVHVIDEHAGHMLQKQPVLLRINPDIDAESHPYISTGRSIHKFGIDARSAEELAGYCFRSNNLHFSGLHIHIGSQVEKLEPVAKSFERTAQFIERFENKGIPVEIINLGGGMPVGYRFEFDAVTHENKLSTDRNNENIISGWASLIPEYFDVKEKRIIIEPGRSVIARCGILLTKVLYTKTQSGRRFIVVDAGMNDFIRPALYGAFHGIVPLTYRGPAKITADVVGPICETGDFFAHDIEISECVRGDYLAVLTTGAYGFVSASNYNMRLRPPELLLENGDIRCIRPREQYSDITS
ncbi:diaminopimelate decarboxylase [candidate division KSB1 bacterium]